MQPTRRRRNNDPALVKSNLLDAAEALFAENGYEGTSVRDIVGVAGLQISSLTYHFGSKQELFAQVVERRLAEFTSEIITSIDAAMEAGGGAPSIEQVIRAYLEPSLRLSHASGPEWRNYVRLITRALTSREHDNVLASLWERLAPMQNRVRAAFSAATPNMGENDRLWATFFVFATASHILSGGDLIDHQSEGLLLTSEITQVLDKMAPFFAAGFDRLSPATRGD